MPPPVIRKCLGPNQKIWFVKDGKELVGNYIGPVESNENGIRVFVPSLNMKLTIFSWKTARMKRLELVKEVMGG
jgi:hypothetical protein